MAKEPLRPRRYWLFKSEPETYGWDRFVKERRTGWGGVRNFQARNLLRDEIRVGDGVLFYHSSADPPAVVGIAKVVGGARPDPTAFDEESEYHDPDGTPDAPKWFEVEIEAVAALREPLPRERLKGVAALSDMELLRRGSRLSVQPVTEKEWRAILALGFPSGGAETW